VCNERDRLDQVHQGISLQLVKKEREEEEDQGREGKETGGFKNSNRVLH